jgi:hypothetical protein
MGSCLHDCYFFIKFNPNQPILTASKPWKSHVYKIKRASPPPPLTHHRRGGGGFFPYSKELLNKNVICTYIQENNDIFIENPWNKKDYSGVLWGFLKLNKYFRNHTYFIVLKRGYFDPLPSGLGLTSTVLASQQIRPPYRKRSNLCFAGIGTHNLKIHMNCNHFKTGFLIILFYLVGVERES